MCLTKYGYVGRWCGPLGIATAELIAPEWIITAPHVVRRKRFEDPDADVTVCFRSRGEKISAKVAEAFLRCWRRGQTWREWKDTVRDDWEEIALARLEKRIDGIAPVGLAENPLSVGEAASIKVFTTIETSRLDTRCKLAKHGRCLVRDRGGGDDGDSGGAWLIKERNGSDVLVGIIQGARGDKAVATQPAVWHDWIETKLREFGARARWVNVIYS